MNEKNKEPLNINANDIMEYYENQIAVANRNVMLLTITNKNLNKKIKQLEDTLNNTKASD